LYAIVSTNTGCDNHLEAENTMGLKFETDSPLLLKLRCGAAASYRGASCCGSLWCDQAATAQNRYGALAVAATASV